MATFLVTGANRGLGLEFTRQLAARGDDVIATARHPDKAADLIALAATHPGERIGIVAMDMLDAGSIEAARRAIGARPIDVLINNAGVIGPRRQSTLDMDFEGFIETLTVNTVAPLRVTQAFLPNLRAAKGKIAAISTRMSIFAEPASSQIAYRSSKAALNRVFQAMALDLAPEGIPVLLLTPGWVRTDMGGRHAPLAPEDSVAGMIAQIDALTVERGGRMRTITGDIVPW
jgi:NAD(P)-dependent dehydrogenase (short-subunit alcohol dehydrogenase family)